MCRRMKDRVKNSHTAEFYMSSGKSAMVTGGGLSFSLFLFFFWVWLNFFFSFMKKKKTEEFMYFVDGQISKKIDTV